MTKIYIPEVPAEETFQLDRSYKKRLTKVMRLSAGDILEVFAPGKRFQCRIVRILPDSIELTVVQQQPSPAEPKIKMILGQAIPKGNRFEWLIQKATELGIAEIYPLVTERTVVKPSNVSSKLQRWSEIAEHAAAQSENGYPAQVHAPVSLSDFIRSAASGVRFLLYEGPGQERLHDLLAGSHSTYIFAVGPEGGWSDNEVQQMSQAGFCTVHLGTRILRSETAGVVLAAIIHYAVGDFSESASVESS